MSYFGDYQRKAIQPGNVDQEGDYQVKITGVKTGELTSDGVTKRYTQVMCLVNYKTRPTVSIFLTEGETFDGNFTAFCDTFGIDPQGRDYGAWQNKTGWIHINLKKKDGFTNMVPRWLLGDDGYVRADVKAAANQPAQQQAAQPMVAPGYEDQYGDIPF